MNHAPSPATTRKQSTTGSLDAEACWNALCRRDPQAEGEFVYAVRTTGIYCRPTCRSRRPLRCNVEFHTTPQSAAAAGYRPCMRCHPDEATPPTRSNDEAITRVCRLIETSERLPSLAEMASAVHMSASHLHRLFKARLGITPKAYASACRSDRARRTLKLAPTVTRALHDAGYESHSAFYGDHERLLGMSATHYRRGAPGETIRYAVTRCRLGHLLVAATARGICAVSLGDSPKPLVEELEATYARAVFAVPDARFRRLLRAVAKLVDEPARTTTLPLDIRGTAFQRRVWETLRAIPPACTTTYAELAIRLGTPKAVRAVGSACAANRLAVVIPCHRVVRSDGGLSGYRWGLERKRALLQTEERAVKRKAVR